MSKLVQADRMKKVELSGIRHLITKADKLAAQGKDIIRLEIGRPDYDTPKHIKDAAIKAINEGKVHYPPIQGIPELRKAIAEKLNKENGLDYKPEEILVHGGASHVIYTAMVSFLNPGDEVLLGNPTYTSYHKVPFMCGATPKYYDLKEENNFQVDRAQMESLITPKTKMICVVNPSNPLGSVLNRESLEIIADIAVKNDLIVVSDEIYERLVYDEDKKFISIATLPGMRNRTITLNGFSKWYSMTGWRLGYSAASAEMTEVLNRSIFYTVTSAGSFVQWGALEALEGTQEPSLEMKAEYKRRRDYLYEALNGIDKLSCLKPEGAFYIFLNIKETGMTSMEFEDYALENGVALVHGDEFGTNGEGYVRLSYASSMDNLVEAVKRIKAAVEKLK